MKTIIISEDAEMFIQHWAKGELEQQQEALQYEGDKETREQYELNIKTLKEIMEQVSKAKA